MKSKKTVIILLTIMAAFILCDRSSIYGYYNDTTKTSEQLANEKTKLEIEKLRIENEDKKSIMNLITGSLAGLITSLSVIAGVIFTIVKLFQERKKDRIQREIDKLRNIDEKFNALVANLGSQSKAVQVGAAVSIQTFLKEEYKYLHRQVLLIVIANLKINHNKTIYNLLIEALEKILKIEIPVMRGENKEFALDLARAYLKNCDFSGYDLSYADFAFAKLKHANLKSANMYKTCGIETDFQNVKLTDANLQEARFRNSNFQFAHFHNANLISAELKECELNGSEFFNASLQSAHFELAYLNNAKFENADIRDAFFYGSVFNDETRKSLLKTKGQSWRKAHFDANEKNKLEQLAAGR